MYLHRKGAVIKKDNWICSYKCEKNQKKKKIN